MNDDDRNERFIRRLTENQSGLFAYLIGLLGDVHESHNVLQETNLVLWRRSADFAEGTDFMAWARTIAHYQILAFYRDRKRDRIVFDEELLGQLAQRPLPAEDDEARRIALRHCLEALPDDDRLMISQRYASGRSIKDLTEYLGKTEGAVKVSLLRIRKKLMLCIGRKLAIQGP